MSEQHHGFAPIDPSAEDDLLAPEREDTASEHEHPGEAHDEETELESAPTEASGAPRRPFVRFAWAALAVFAIIGLLIFAELARITSAVNNSACIQRAQAQFMQAYGPGVSPQYAGLDRLTASNQLKKCDK